MWCGEQYKAPSSLVLSYIHSAVPFPLLPLHVASPIAHNQAGLKEWKLTYLEIAFEIWFSLLGRIEVI